MKYRVNSRDFLLAFAAIITGMAFIFVILSSSTVSYRLLIGLLGLGTALTALSLWKHTHPKKAKREREIMVCKETVLVDINGSAEIVFGPSSPMEDPTVYLTAHGRPVIVEEVQHGGVSLLAVPRDIAFWNKGVCCPGTVDADHPLRILVRNQGFAIAAVRASLSSRKKEI
jgi:hypothetical protein